MTALNFPHSSFALVLEPVVTLLVEKEIFVTSVNALRMKKFCAQSIRKAKTDRIDSIKIAMYGLIYKNQNKLEQPAGSSHARVSELLADMNDGHKLTDFVKHYWHFGDILKMGERKFATDYCTWAKNKDTV